MILQPPVSVQSRPANLGSAWQKRPAEIPWLQPRTTPLTCATRACDEPLPGGKIAERYTPHPCAAGVCLSGRERSQNSEE
eukprot:scaffold1219_cov400-Prasinococcus_capsulatus_cf.AAC.13